MRRRSPFRRIAALDIESGGGLPPRLWHPRWWLWRFTEEAAVWADYHVVEPLSGWLQEVARRAFRARAAIADDLERRAN